MPREIGDHIGEHNWYQRAELSQDISRADKKMGDREKCTIGLKTNYLLNRGEF